MSDFELNWRAISSLEELDRCLSVASNQLRDALQISNWLSRQGFDVADPLTYSARTMIASFGYNGEGALISASIPKKPLDIGLSLVQVFDVHSLSVGILLDEDGEPLKVSSSLSRN